MSDDEREGWRHSLERVATRDDAIENILDRVERLESDLALKVDALRIARAERDEALEAARKAHAELAAARTEPPRPSHLVHAAGGHWHAFESGTDAYKWMASNDADDLTPRPYTLHSWTYHPAKETP